MKSLVFVLVSSSMLAGCVQPGIQDQRSVSDDGRYTTTQISAYSGRHGDVIQTALLIWDNKINQYVINTSTGSAPLSDQLLRDLFSIGIGAVINGEYGLRIASAGKCQAGRVCGDWIHVEANSGSSAGAVAGAEANASISRGAGVQDMSYLLSLDSEQLNQMLRSELGGLDEIKISFVQGH